MMQCFGPFLKGENITADILVICCCMLLQTQHKTDYNCVAEKIHWHVQAYLREELLIDMQA